MKRSTMTASRQVSAVAIAATVLAVGQLQARPATAQNPEAGPATTLFVSGPNMGFVGFDNAQTLSGANVGVTTELSLSSRVVSQPRGAALDANGALYLISGANRGSIAVYDDPLQANGTRRPDRMVFGDQTLISRSPTGITIDRENGLLYVSTARTGLLMFDISSPTAFDGNVAPVHTFDVDMAQFAAQQICFASGSLYVVDARGGTSDILAFDNPAALQGKVIPDRIINHEGYDNRIGAHVDAEDRLLVAVRKLGQVLIHHNASTLDGPVTPDVALSITGGDVAPMPSFAMTDSEDRLYVADSNGNVVFAIEQASQLASGARAADRTIDSTDLIAPNRLLLWERR